MLARFAKPLFVVVVLAIPIGIGSCKTGDPSAPQNLNPPDSTAFNDFITQSRNGGPESTYIEASGLPTIDCDPRVDWAASQVVLWHTFTGTGAVNGYDHFFEIMFPVADTVGTYTVQNFLQALVYDGQFYSAGPFPPGSSGTVEVTRSDTLRIEGTYALTVVDSAQTDSLRLSGRFGIDNGFSLSCP